MSKNSLSSSEVPKSSEEVEQFLPKNVFLYKNGCEIMVRLKCVFLDAKCLIWQWLKGKKLTLRRFFFFKAELHICFDLFHT